MNLVGRNVYVRLIEERDAEAWLALNIRNKEFFQAYTPKRDEDYYTIENHEKMIKNTIKGREQDQLYSFGIFLIESDQLIGNIALMDILRGGLQSCFIGYSLDKQHNGKGYMTEAVKLVTEYGFTELGLHRIEAGVMPHNIGSIKVLEKAGYEKEGIARKNVKINGKWEDHQMLAIINPNDEI